MAESATPHRREPTSSFPTYLASVLENLVDGTVANQIKVDRETADNARVALERMLEIT